MVYSPNHPNVTKLGYILEHRLVMEKKIGRYLKPREVVHHINKDREDNRLENLELTPNQAKHNDYHPRTRDKITGRFI